MKTILNCQNCNLYKNQTPTISKIQKSDIMLIGISAQKNKINKIFTALDPDTNSGKFIQQIENKLPKLSFYKTNLIKCAPLNPENKIRYPTTKEYQTCFNHLKNEIKKVNPKIIILLGEKVANFITKKFQIKKEKYKPIPHKDKIIIYIDHPSYLMIYKRKQLKKYQNKITELITKNLNFSTTTYQYLNLLS